MQRDIFFERREREKLIASRPMHTLWLPQVKISIHVFFFFFPINIDPIHIGRVINSAISRDAYLSARLPSSLIVVREILNGAEMEIKLRAKSRMKRGEEKGREKEREKSNAKWVDSKRQQKAISRVAACFSSRIIFKSSFPYSLRQILSLIFTCLK